jgi:hypothetical protein
MAIPTKAKPLRVVHNKRDETSRLFAIAFGQFFQRVCRLQLAHVEGDIDLAIIAGAAALAGTDSMMRDPATRREYGDLNKVVGDRQRGCNALSIAEATGLPRETVRRKMNRLVEMGILVRRGVGDYIWQPGVLQSAPYRQTLDDIAAAAARLANECLEQEIFTLEPPTP